ncbi:hypothetical protein QR90_08765 [Deinococcus radiopugnans]|uniref:Uncharacterized protein n=1 Tax=Deinococcus radiopugnans TaxID=57497 RepID=A0A0A7KGE4_9DEIO|nr:hypothetical protein QR90_08765 [Deinococcus radiopugnans]
MKRRPFWGALLHRAQAALWRACRVLPPDAHPGQGPSWGALPARRPSETLFGTLEGHVELAGGQGGKFKLQALLGACALLIEGNPVDVGDGQQTSDLSCTVCVHDGLRQGAPS